MAHRSSPPEVLSVGPRGLLIGPDGHAYRDMRSPIGSGPELDLRKVCELAIAHGHGIVVNPTEQGAEWIFSLGDLVAYQQRGTFSGGLTADTARTTTSDEEVQVGEPDEQVLPMAVRAHIKAWVRENLGLSDVGVALVLNKNDDPPLSLMFDWSRLPEGDIARAVHGVAWFCPPTAPSAYMPGVDLPFVPL